MTHKPTSLKPFRPKKRPIALDKAEHALSRAIVRGEPKALIDKLRVEVNALLGKTEDPDWHHREDIAQADASRRDHSRDR